MGIYFTRSDQTWKRRQLRGNATLAERILWSRLKNRQILGCKFRRQHSVGKFVIDFYSAECHLAVELDGEFHASSPTQEYDKQRQTYIKSFGIRFLRFTNRDIFDRLDEVIEAITNEIRATRNPNSTRAPDCL